ncbi:globin-like protein [Euroglyphus maynei]|uniref:Globin-like protein n=1 Tax=Euroglyphus maynei TaxID=6958 RepID=A0A1Y3BHE1_EURMA|nr:globin-like protein [Euroglyphus maynei]
MNNNNICVEFCEEELQSLRIQWDKIVHYQQECFGLKLFLRLLDLHPEYLCLFGFTWDEFNYHETNQLRAHGINVMYMLNMLFDNLNDMDMFDELIGKLIRLHLCRGIQKSWFDDLCAPFLTILEDFSEKLSIEHPESIYKAFMFIKNRIQQLYDDNLAEILMEQQNETTF